MIERVVGRATKLLVLCWTIAALLLQSYLVARGWNFLWPGTAALFAIFFVASTVWPRTTWMVLPALYVFPAALLLLHDGYHPYDGVLLMAALLGIVAADAIRTEWHVPRRWRAPIVCWALVVCIGATVTAAREVDFYPSIIYWSGYIWSSRGGLAPVAVVQWVLHVALVLITGLLWFDWLCGNRVRDFKTDIVAPLVISVAIMAGVAIYQGFVDVLLLNPTVFGGTGRAAGTLLDANVCGTLAALWIGGVALVRQPRSRWQLYGSAVFAMMLWLCVWATGSRTALAEASLVTCAVGVSAFAASPVDRRKWIVARALVIALIGGAGIGILARSGVPAVGPLRRIGKIGKPSPDLLRYAAKSLWSRNYYGLVANAMIRKSPWFGVGVGAYQVLLPDYAVAFVPTLALDNAQNWFRHQLAEFGIVGSIGWMWWLCAFAFTAIRGLMRKRWKTIIPLGMLLAFTAISLVGMPSQDLAVALTFWVFVAWYDRIDASDSAVSAEQPENIAIAGRAPWLQRSATRWVAVAAVVVIYAAGAIALSLGTLRVPMRAASAGWPYSYGFYDPEPDPGGGELRWAAKRAVAVVDARTKTLALTISVNHADVAVHPVDARVWVDRRLVMSAHLTSTQPFTKYVHLGSEEPRIIIETEVNRTVRPSDFGLADGRALGLMVKWDFVTSHDHG